MCVYLSRWIFMYMCMYVYVYVYVYVYACRWIYQGSKEEEMSKANATPTPNPNYKGHNNKSSKPGLKRLKYYCEVCQKQCSDANGFRNHENSDSHMRNMQFILSENPLGYIESMSTKFEEQFIEKAKFFKGKKVKAKIVYESMRPKILKN